MVRKLYIDARAKKAGTYSDFTWQTDRPILVEKSRAFIDSVHIPNSFGTINSTNQYVYLTEEQQDFTVLSNLNKLYIQETPGGERIIALTPGLYNTEALLATELQTQLGGNYTVTSATGSLTITNSVLTSWKIFSRAEIQTKKIFASQIINQNNVQDISDLFGNAVQAMLGPSHNITLGKSKLYRQISIPSGNYNITDLAAAFQTSLNTGTSLPNTYLVTANSLTGKLNITNSSTLIFEIYPETYLNMHLKAFLGYSSPFYGADHAIGFTLIQTGNNITSDMHVNVQRYHTLFINSDLGTHNDSIGPMSQSSIARKVTVDQPHGSMIHDFHSLPYDYIQLEKQSINAISFRLTDWQGHPIEMLSSWSLSIIIVPEEEF